MKQLLIGTMLSAALAFAACGGAEAPATESPTTAAATAEPASENGEMVQTCITSFTRQRECTDAFLPALLDARIAADKPEGIAARADAEGKDALLVEAATEWESDSSDAMIRGNCEKIVADMPAEHVKQMGDAVSACLAAADCDAFVACQIPVIAPTLR